VERFGGELRLSRLFFYNLQLGYGAIHIDRTANRRSLGRSTFHLFTGNCDGECHLPADGSRLARMGRRTFTGMQVGRSIGAGDRRVGRASPVSRRPVYRGVAEVSIYVAEPARGCGIGSKLMTGLIADSEAEGIWTLQAGIFPENTGSIELHRKAGFRVVGTRSRLGHMDGRWRDVVLLERRSLIAGT
jgi:L-amino acid N-acyltransferase YncA